VADKKISDLAAAAALDGTEIVPVVQSAATVRTTAQAIAARLTSSGGSDLTQVSDTNVTLTLGGTPTGALLKASSITVGWAGTLAAGRLNSNVVQSIINDTNVTGSISAQNLTLAWSGTLAVARGGTASGLASGTALDNITGFSSTGILARTASGTYAFRTITGTANRVTLTNGDGVSGNPTVDISSSYAGQATITTLGTITIGTWTGTTIAAVNGGTGQISYTTGDLLYASSASALAKLAAVATGQVVRSAGASVAPAWAYEQPVSPMGRLTLTSGTPVLTATVSAATTIYYALYVGDRIPIYDASGFVDTIFTELSNVTTNSATGKAGPAAVTINSNYDLFVWNDSGTVRLTRGPAWTSDSARGTGAGTSELQRLNGIWTNKVAITNGPAANAGTYVGTVRSDGSSQINFQFGSSGSGTAQQAIFGVWNAYNRVVVGTVVQDSTGSWTYTSTTVRASNASNGNRISLIRGLDEDSVLVTFCQRIQPPNTNSNFYQIGIGLDSTTTFAQQAYIQNPSTATGISITIACGYAALPGLGWHFLQALESNGDNTNAGTAVGSPFMQLTGTIRS
jgi:hypothetical protein